MAASLRPLAAVALVIVAVACGFAPDPQTPAPSPTPAQRPAGRATTGAPPPTPAATGDPVTVLAVGDIASCDSDNDEAVADVVSEQPGVVMLLGDIVYDDGTRREYAECFDPSWGPLRHRLRPALGNHDFRGRDSDGYFDYWGATAGQEGEGWYAYDLGEHWRAVVLNSNCQQISCDAASPQGEWLQEALTDAGERHIIAYWHHPRFSTGRHGSDPSVGDFWRLLHDAGAAIVLNGHDHIYERFAPQDPQGSPDPEGMRQFTVGVGGFTLYEFSTDALDTTEVRNNDAFGVLRLELLSDGYRWRFLPAIGDFTDSGRHTFDSD